MYLQFGAASELKVRLFVWYFGKAVLYDFLGTFIHMLTFLLLFGIQVSIEKRVYFKNKGYAHLFP